MFQFLIGLASAVYIGGRCFMDGVNHDIYESRAKHDSDYRERLKAKAVCSISVESEVEGYINSGENIEEIVEENADDFRVIFGDNWEPVVRSALLFRRRETVDDCVWRFWIKQLLTAKRSGRVTWRFLGDSGSSMYTPQGIENPNIDIAKRFCERINKYLRAYGRHDVILTISRPPALSDGLIRQREARLFEVKENGGLVYPEFWV